MGFENTNSESLVFLPGQDLCCQQVPFDKEADGSLETLVLGVRSTEILIQFSQIFTELGGFM